MNKKTIFALAAILLISGCADHLQVAISVERVGFWFGLWHGIILPFSWLMSLFLDDVAIYAVYNNGGWYNFGFVLGLGVLGSSSRAA